MKKLLLTFSILCCLYANVSGQQKKVDSLQALLPQITQDSSKAKTYLKIAQIYWTFKTDSAIFYANKSYQLGVSLNNDKIQFPALLLLGIIYTGIDYGIAVTDYLKAKEIAERSNDPTLIIQVNNYIANDYIYKHDFSKVLQYLTPNVARLHKLDIDKAATPRRLKVLATYTFEGLSKVYIDRKMPDSATFYLNKAIELAQQVDFHDSDAVFATDRAVIQTLMGNNTEAIKYFKQAIGIELKAGDIGLLDLTYLGVANAYENFHQVDSAIYYAKKLTAAAKSGGFPQDVLDGDKLLSRLYDKQNNIPEAYKYDKEADSIRDSIFTEAKVRTEVSSDFVEQQHKQELQAAQADYKNQIRTNMLLGGLGTIAAIALVFWRNSRQRQRANITLKAQKEEIEQTLTKLKETQRQLIQSEKMASLGELTAGIAHEIQNPLNFVNNFSEVNREMIDELKLELKNGNVEEALLIADDILQNEEKITHHGKRADGIVKSMLQHSRASSGVKEPTDINNLADEYLRLAYHGLRAKDKSFNADMVSHFGENLPLINVMPQDVGRVLLNMFTNAFYAVQQKQKTAGADYKPTVEVSTTVNGAAISIKVKDNGIGISDDIKDKILQPFFTTKPTGEGTGLGLSLSYDIVKTHSGTIDIQSVLGEGSEFIITLPIS